MENFLDLEQLYNQIKKEIASKPYKEFELPIAFKSQLPKIGDRNIEYLKYTAIANKKNADSIIIPNYWFYLAMDILPFNKELHRYYDQIVGMNLFSSERLSKLKNQELTEEEKKRIEETFESEEDAKKICRFLTDYNWWHGGKELGRGQKDYYVSAVLSLSGLINDSSSYLATICEALRENPNLVDILSNPNKNVTTNTTLQQIFFGAPGTGKSNTIKEQTEIAEKEGRLFRTTFHPDSDYASFVGCYKPMKEKTPSQLLNSGKKDNGNLTETELISELQAAINSTNNIKTYNWFRFGIDYYSSLKKYLEVNGNNLHNLVNKAMNFGNTPFSQDTFIKTGMQIYEDIQSTGSSESKITYSFVPQVFTNAYVKAWNTEDDVYLIIEEINRGNCAQIFGDLFQLLDRQNGTSEYPIDADIDLRDYLYTELANSSRTDFPEGVKEGKKLVLPSNLYIWATMNTSDQSLFPMDSAFKRRWDWEYIPICYDETTQDGKENKAYQFKITINDRVFSWINFLRVVNLLVKDATDSEDKQMGNFFIKHDVKEKEFISKVMFYLWSEVCKDNFGSRQNFFRKKDDKEFSFNELFDDKDHKILLEFMERLQDIANEREELKDKGIKIEIEEDNSANNTTDTSEEVQEEG